MSKLSSVKEGSEEIKKFPDIYISHAFKDDPLH